MAVQPSTLSFSLPCCRSSNEVETKGSRIVRITAVVMGALLLLVGILIFSGLPAFSAIGTTDAALILAAGGLMLLGGLCIRYVNKGTEKQADTQRPYSNFFEACEEFIEKVKQFREHPTAETAESLRHSSAALREIVLNPPDLTPELRDLYIKIFRTYTWLAPIDSPILASLPLYNRLRPEKQQEVLVALEQVESFIDANFSHYMSS